MLNIESKALLDICQELGYDVKNQLSGLDPDQREAIEQRVKRGHGGGTATLVAPAKPVAPPVLEKKIKVLDQRVRPPQQGRPISPAPPAQPVPPAPAAEKPAPPAPAAVAPPPPVTEAPPAAQPTPPAAAPKPVTVP